MTKKLTSACFFLLKVVVIVIIGYFFIRKINTAEIYAWVTADVIRGCLVIQPLVLVCALLTAFRLAILIGTPVRSFYPVLSSVILSAGFNHLFPTRLAELIKPVYLKQKLSLPMSSGLASVFLERLIDMFTCAVFLIIYMSMTFLNSHFELMILGFLIFFAVVMFFLFSEKSFCWVLKWMPGEKVRIFLMQCFQFAAERVRQAKFYQALLVSFVLWFMTIMMTGLFMHAAGSISLSWQQIMTLFLATTLSYAVPILPGAIGTYEAAVIFVLHKAGYSFNEAFVLAVFLHVSQFFIIISWSIFLILREKIDIRQFVRT